MKVCLCTSEMFPFAKTGGLADVCGTLPLALEKEGIEICVFMPRYNCVDESGVKIESLNSKLSTATVGENVKVYFIENKDYFYRDGLYGDSKGDYYDNLERFSFYCIKVLKFLKELDIKADIIHCNDWQTALIPVYLKETFKHDEFYSGMKTLVSIHNLAFQGIFPKRDYKKIGLSEELFNLDGFEFFGKINLLKAGLINCDLVTTVSKQYAKEIKTKEYGCGLNEVLKSFGKGVDGILNGINYDVWDPHNDSLIEEKYNDEDLINSKLKNKIKLQEIFNLPVNKNIPLFGLVGRLSHQKGIDLIIKMLDFIMPLDIQVVIQGVGEEKYYHSLKEVSEKFPDNIKVLLDFDEKTAHQIYAGSDMFLMPSHYEPCGLSQMISFRYGTIPVVYRTGGLADTVIPWDSEDSKGNGFIFNEYNKKSFAKVIKTAIKVFQDKDKFSSLINNAFNVRFSWDKSAKAYKREYQCLLSD